MIFYPRLDDVFEIYEMDDHFLLCDPSCTETSARHPSCMKASACDLSCTEASTRDPICTDASACDPSCTEASARDPSYTEASVCDPTPSVSFADIALSDGTPRFLNIEAKDRLTLLLQEEYPDGLAIDELTGAYKGLYGATLDDLSPERYGYLSLRALLESDCDVVHVKCFNDNVMIYSSQIQFTDQMIVASFLPVKAVSFGSIYQSLDRNALLPEGEYVDVVIAEVYSPQRFWVVHRGVQTSEALHCLMDRMLEFYKSKIGDRYVVSNDLITIGAPIATLCSDDKNYYRALITSIEDIRTVKLFLVDYGTVCRSDYSHLRLLHQHFFTLPAQAIKAALDKVLPADGRRLWSKPASKRFLHMVQDKGLVAQVTMLKETVYFDLWDTSGKADVNVADLLIVEGWAISTLYRSTDYLAMGNRKVSEEDTIATDYQKQNMMDAQQKIETVGENQCDSLSKPRCDLIQSAAFNGMPQEMGIDISICDYTKERPPMDACITQNRNLGSQDECALQHEHFVELLSGCDNRNDSSGTLQGYSCEMMHPNILQSTSRLCTYPEALQSFTGSDNEVGKGFPLIAPANLVSPKSVSLTNSKVLEPTCSSTCKTDQKHLYGNEKKIMVDTTAVIGPASRPQSVQSSQFLSSRYVPPPPGFEHLYRRQPLTANSRFSTSTIEALDHPKVPSDFVEETSHCDSSCQVDQESECKTTRRIVRVKLTSQCNFHIILLYGDPYVLASEISTLLWNEDHLERILQQRSLEFPRISIGRFTDKELYLQLHRLGSSAIFNKDICDIRPCLSAYSLHDVPTILELLGFDNETIINAVKDLAKKYTGNKEVPNALMMTDNIKKPAIENKKNFSSEHNRHTSSSLDTWVHTLDTAQCAPKYYKLEDSHVASDECNDIECMSHFANTCNLSGNSKPAIEINNLLDFNESKVVTNPLHFIQLAALLSSRKVTPPAPPGNFTPSFLKHLDSVEGLPPVVCQPLFQVNNSPVKSNLGSVSSHTFGQQQIYSCTPPPCRHGEYDQLKGSVLQEDVVIGNEFSGLSEGSLPTTISRNDSRFLQYMRNPKLLDSGSNLKDDPYSLQHVDTNVLNFSKVNFPSICSVSISGNGLHNVYQAEKICKANMLSTSCSLVPNKIKPSHILQQPQVLDSISPLPSITSSDFPSGSVFKQSSNIVDGMDRPNPILQCKKAPRNPRWLKQAMTNGGLRRPTKFNLDVSLSTALSSQQDRFSFSQCVLPQQSSLTFGKPHCRDSLTVSQSACLVDKNNRSSITHTIPSQLLGQGDKSNTSLHVGPRRFANISNFVKSSWDSFSHHEKLNQSSHSRTRFAVHKPSLRTSDVLTENHMNDRGSERLINYLYPLVEDCETGDNQNSVEHITKSKDIIGSVYSLPDSRGGCCVPHVSDKHVESLDDRHSDQMMEGSRQCEFMIHVKDADNKSEQMFSSVINTPSYDIHCNDDPNNNNDDGKMWNLEGNKSFKELVLNENPVNGESSGECDNTICSLVIKSQSQDLTKSLDNVKRIDSSELGLMIQNEVMSGSLNQQNINKEILQRKERQIRYGSELLFKKSLKQDDLQKSMEIHDGLKKPLDNFFATSNKRIGAFHADLSGSGTSKEGKAQKEVSQSTLAELDTPSIKVNRRQAMGGMVHDLAKNEDCKKGTFRRGQSYVGRELINRKTSPLKTAGISNKQASQQLASTARSLTITADEDLRLKEIRILRERVEKLTNESKKNPKLCIEGGDERDICKPSKKSQQSHVSITEGLISQREQIDVANSGMPNSVLHKATREIPASQVSCSSFSSSASEKSLPRREVQVLRGKENGEHDAKDMEQLMQELSLLNMNLQLKKQQCKCIQDNTTVSSVQSSILESCNVDILKLKKKCKKLKAQIDYLTARVNEEEYCTQKSELLHGQHKDDWKAKDMTSVTKVDNMATSEKEISDIYHMAEVKSKEKDFEGQTSLRGVALPPVLGSQEKKTSVTAGHHRHCLPSTVDPVVPPPGYHYPMNCHPVMPPPEYHSTMNCHPRVILPLQFYPGLDSNPQLFSALDPYRNVHADESNLNPNVQNQGHTYNPRNSFTSHQYPPRPF